MSERSGWAQWLDDAVQVVRAGADDATDHRELVAAAPEELVAEGVAQFVWIAGLDDDQIRVRAASEPDAPATLSAPEQAATTRAIEEERVVVSSALHQTAAYSELAEAMALPDATAAAHVPFAALGETAVVHVWTDRDVTGDGVPELASVFGAALSDNLARLTAEDHLERERARLETVRSTISHDLGNPVNLASGRLELAAEECESSHLSHVMGALEEIDAMTSDSVSYVEAGQPVTERERRSVDEIVEATWEQLSTGENTLVTEPVSVRGEPERLRRLLSELLTNALEHTDSPVEVSVGPLAENRGFYLADTGDGVLEDEREFVFDRGYTTDPERDGAGLALAREIAGAHDWQLRLAEASTGARFEVVTERW
jgi:signal transduction histidine kinase